MADQQVRFQIVIDKDTGAVKAVATDLEEVKKKAQGIGQDAKKAGADGGEAFKTMGGKVREFAMGVLVAQLALEGLKKIAQQNDAFQELQATFGEAAKSLIEVLQPAITMVSKGLSGLLTIVGGAAKALKAMASGEFSEAGNIMAGSIEKAAGIIEGRVQVLTKNLASLNTIYELELQESNNHLKALNSFYGKLSETSAQMLHSAEDAKKVQEQIGTLATNLGRLNSIYGNMLTAMQGRS